MWCEDEAGPYQTRPYAGASWAPEGRPARQPHEYLRDQTAKVLTLFRPATGIAQVKGVTTTTNVVLHTWLQAAVRQQLATLPPLDASRDRPALAQWETWLGRPRPDLPSLRALLIWDNLVGHTSADIYVWLIHQGVMPLYTPLSGSWLNMAESLQRILARRALEGQEYETPAAIIEAYEQTAVGWNAQPTPFVWGGKRAARRVRAKARRLQHLGGSGACLSSPFLFTR